ncbi:MAG TPA: hypothetical protein VM533_03870 [Fimbriiglobus sp.]|nr:hypothetical protein [Fimbriiglobus sp.]
MYRFVYPAILVALYAFVCRIGGTTNTVTARQPGPVSPQLFNLSDYDSLVATYYRPGITTAEQHAILRTLGSQPNNRAGIRFLIYMLEVDFPDGSEPPLFYVGGLDAIPARNLLAEKALVELGPAAAHQLVDEYLVVDHY